jgi:fatty-acyl-CoA synthase
VSRARTLAGLLRERAQSHPDTLAIRFKEGNEWVSWTWGEYWTQASNAARALAERGFAPGDHVMMLVPDVRTAVTSLFGLWSLGAVPTILGAPYRLNDMAGYLSQLRATAQKLDAKALILSDVLRPMAGEAEGVRLVSAEDLCQAGHDRGLSPDPDAAPGPCLIQLTSGSTQHPRGVVLEHERVMLHMQSMSQALPSPEHAVAVSWLPLHHDMGLLGGLLFPFFNDFPAHMISPLDFRARPYSWLEAMSRFKATICAAPPSAYAICLPLAGKALEDALDLSAWEVAMIGAEPVSPRLLSKFSAAFAPCRYRPEAFFPVYGLAEATVAVTFPEKLTPSRVDCVDRSQIERDGRAVPCESGPNALELTGLGRAIPHTELRVVDERNQPCPERVQGEILVRSRTLMKGYYAEPDTTTRAFWEGWLRTGDLGYLADGRLFVTGRKKEIIIRGGQNLVPAAIEDVAATVDGVRAGCLAAVGVRLPERETELAYLVAETKVNGEARARLAEAIRERLKVHGIFIDQVALVPPGTLPKTTSGKIRRRSVAEAIESGRFPEALG